jgi:murein DD-endopeptidase MepM/ murein hydrolase activator NlpD
MNKRLSKTICTFVIVFLSFSFLTACNLSKTDIELSEPNLIEEISELIEKVVELDEFGLPASLYRVDHRTVRNGESLSTLLAPYGVGGALVNELVAASTGQFNIRSIMSGRRVSFYYDEENERLDFMVYQPNNRGFVVFDLHDTPSVFRGEFEQEIEIKRVEATIDGSLYVSLLNEGGSPALVSLLSNVFAWQVDFYRIQRGDRIAVVYEEVQIGGKPAGIGRILAARLTHRNREYDAFLFSQGNRPDYFDLDGNSLRKAFLRAPLEYTRISSRFTNRRFHPVLGRNMPHHGTDYAAPTGTPIRAVGDGEIVHAGFDRNNGNYIRIRHNSVYETGYLHMSRMAPGMRRGARVTQGQIIGYVGATGLATGPHLCFRFWQNGQPVDPYRVDMPASNPIADVYRNNFNIEKSRLLALLFPGDFEEEEEFDLIFVASEPYKSPSKPFIFIN